jgi:hypothetical protein
MNKIAASWNKKVSTQPGFDPVTTSMQVQYAATEPAHTLYYIVWIYITQRTHMF